MNSLFTVLLIFLGLSPALFTWLRERRLARLALAELRIAQAVSAMESHMMNGFTTNGKVCHDFVFQVMLRVQDTRSYRVRWNIFKGPSARQTEARQRLEVELSEDGCPFREDVANFCRAHFEAFTHKHPIQQKFYFVYIAFVYVGTKGLIYCLRRLLDLFDGWEKFMDFLRRQFFIQAGALEADGGPSLTLA